MAVIYSFYWVSGSAGLRIGPKGLEAIPSGIATLKDPLVAIADCGMRLPGELISTEPSDIR